MRQQSRAFRKSTIALAVASALSALPAQAGLVQWSANGDGFFWSDADNWHPGLQPVTGDDVRATDELTFQTPTIVYDNSVQPASLNSVVVDASFSVGLAVLDHQSGSLNSATVLVGESGGGLYALSMGASLTTSHLGLGIGQFSAGIFNNNGGQINVVGQTTLVVGDAGFGEFNQTGGTTNDTRLIVGNQVTGNGTVNLSGGDLIINGDGFVGLEGTGAVNHDNGDGASQLVLNTTGPDTGGSLVLGARSGSSGTYVITDLNGNPVSVTVNRDLVIGGDGSGTFTQNGGQVTAPGLYLAGGPDPDAPGGGFGFADSGSSGTYNLNDGTLSSGFASIGTFGAGTFNQNGGTHTAGFLLLGNGGGTGANSLGIYNQDGGDLTSDNTTVGGFGRGEFNQSAGTHTTTGLVIGDGPAVGGTPSRQGTYNLSGGDLLVKGNTIVGKGNDGFTSEPGGLGFFNHTGGSHTVTGDLFVGGFGVEAGGTGTYTLDLAGGLLVQGSMVVGQDGGPVSPGTGTFEVKGGSATIENFLTVGEGANGIGTLAISGGTLTTGNAIIGLNGSGTATQSGGLYQTGFLNVGGGGFSGTGSGSYTISAGTLTIANDLVLGNDVGGTGSVTQTGGSVSVNSAAFGLFINNGSYVQSGGTLAIANDSFVGDVASGSFTENGGSQTVGRDLVVGTQTGVLGTFTLQSGTVGVTRDTVVGRDGDGTINQSGGTLTTGRVILGQNAGGSGAYNLSGGTLNDDAIVGDAGVGTFTNSGGAHNVTGNLILGNQSTGSGTYNLSGTGSTTVSAAVRVGNLGTGEFNQSGGSLSAAGMDVNVGSTVAFSGGTFNLNGGTLSNVGSVTLSGTGTRTIQGGVKNNATFVINNTSAVFEGLVNNNGSFASNASSNLFLGNLVVGASGFLTGGLADVFTVNGNFINGSTENTSWNTASSTLRFMTLGTHQFALAGLDLGTGIGGLNDNFAWGNLTLASGAGLNLTDGVSGNASTALYLGLLGLADGLAQLTDISSPFNIYYDATLGGNAYLNGQTYKLAGGGLLCALGGDCRIGNGGGGGGSDVPEPATLLLVGVGLAGLRMRMRARA